MSEESKMTAPATEKPEADPVNERVKQYNRVVRIAKLSSILLEKISFQISPEIYGAEKINLKRELNASTNIMAYDAEGGDCVASIVWTIAIKYRRKNLVKCVANYVIIYDEMKNCQADAVKVFIDHVGKTATYAYFRALYAHLDWSANLGSAPLPVVQFQPKIHPTSKGTLAVLPASETMKN